jgi:hypothetical protein
VKRNKVSLGEKQMKQIKRFLVTAALIGALSGIGPAKATSIEMMAGNESATIDAKIGTTLVDTEEGDLNLFSRTKVRASYDGEVSPFSLVDLSYDLPNGLGLVGEVQLAPSLGVVPRIGAQYFTSIDDFSIYALATMSVNPDPNAEFLLSLSYAPEIRDDLSLYAGLENLTSFGSNGHNFSCQDLRLGFEKGNFSFGAAATITEIGAGEDLSVDTNVGGYFRTSF